MEDFKLFMLSALAGSAQAAIKTIVIEFRPGRLAAPSQPFYDKGALVSPPVRWHAGPGERRPRRCQWTPAWRLPGPARQRGRGGGARHDPAEQRIEIQGRLGAVDRDGPPGGQYLVAVTAAQVQVPVADQIQVADVRRGPLVQRQGLVDAELHPGFAATVDQFDVGDLADLDADGRLDFVATGGATNNVTLFRGTE